MRGTDHNVLCYWPDLAVKQPLKLVPLLDWHRDLGFVSGVNKDHRSSLIKLSRMGKKKMVKGDYHFILVSVPELRRGYTHRSGVRG